MIRVLSVQFFQVHKLIEDMLRYDAAFACDKFPNVIAYMRFSNKSGKWGGEPTVERWRSFLAGFNPTPIGPMELRNLGILATIETMCADGWYTIQPYGRHWDLTSDAKISLTDYLKGE